MNFKLNTRVPLQQHTIKASWELEQILEKPNAIQFIKCCWPPHHQEYVTFVRLHPNEVLFIIPTAPFQPPTEEWQKILGDIRKGIEKVDNDFSTTCQGKKVCNFDCKFNLTSYWASVQ